MERPSDNSLEPTFYRASIQRLLTSLGALKQGDFSQPVTANLDR